jgi:exopolysaccharide biosynthesis protein
MTKDGPVIKENPSEAEVKAARWAFSAGPWLVRVRQSLRISRLRSIDVVSRGSLKAPGVREPPSASARTGRLSTTPYMSATLLQMQAAMLSLGCRDAIGLDGGGSVGVIDPSGKVLIGYTSRQVCCALVFRRLVDEHPAEVPATSPTSTERR